MKLFPFSHVRPGQKEFIDDIEYALEKGLNLIASAPTGIGKTVATLSPSVEYALKNNKVVLFLTPKHSQHMIAVETLRLMKKKADFVAVDLIGKKWLCPIEGVDFLSTNEFNEYCKYLRKEEKCPFYNNTWEKGQLTKGAQIKIKELAINSPIHADEVKLLVEKYCVYELLMNLAKQSHVIIADYYHVFSPYANLLLRLGRKLEDVIIIVDEAHNLPDRIRKLMSTTLSTKSLNRAIKEADRFGFDTVKKYLKDMNKILKSLGERERFLTRSELIDKIRKIADYTDILATLKVAADEVREEKKRSYISSVAKFLEEWEKEDFGYSRIFRTVGENRIIMYNCLDPSLISKDIFEKAHTTILMSGTMKPMEMYVDVLGLGKERTLTKEYRSPFPKKNRLDIIVPGITTKYSKRGEKMWSLISDYIISISDAIPGNLAVFFPSYEIRDVIMNLCSGKTKKPIIPEIQNSTKQEKSATYRKFLSHSLSGAILFGVLGGSFSEGVDFPGNAINGVVIVGLSLKQPTLDAKALIDYYDEKFHRGWDYAYIYPAVQRSLQAAGRCIRSERDRGVVVYLDERYLWTNYRKLFPIDMNIKVTKDPVKHIKEFFK